MHTVHTMFYNKTQKLLPAYQSVPTGITQVVLSDHRGIGLLPQPGIAHIFILAIKQLNYYLQG